MAYARTQEEARERVRLKRAIRRGGCSIRGDATLKEIKRVYRDCRWERERKATRVRN